MKAILVCQGFNMSTKSIIGLIVIVVVIAGATIGGIMGSRAGGKAEEDKTTPTSNNG